MARYLFVVPPFAGHVFPAVSVARELASRGHDIAWASTSDVRNWLPEGARLYEAAVTITDAVADDLRERTGASWVLGLKVFWQEVIIPLCDTMLPAVEAAIDDFNPTTLIVDQQALAGALAARRHGLPWVTSSTTAQLHSNALGSYPRVEAWIQEQLAQVQRDAGLEPVDWPDRSTRLVILFTTRELIGLEKRQPEHYCFVGPAIGNRPGSADFPWQSLTESRRLLVSLGSTFGRRGGHLLEVLKSAFADTSLQVIVTASPELMQPVPANFIVRQWLPQVELLSHVDAVLTHAGSTVNEALAFGLPLVVAPITQDQPIFAQEAVDAGAALRVRYNRVTAAELQSAVLRVMNEAAFRTAAQRIQASFREAGGAKSAADAVEALA